MIRRPASSASGAIPWLVLLTLATLLPRLSINAFYLNAAVLALVYVTLAVAFDIVAGRVGALSLAQSLFIGFGAYLAAWLSSHYQTDMLVELAAAVPGAAILAVLVGIPSFRLSLHSFAIGTLGFAIVGQLVAQNWMSVTGGPLCLAGVAPLRLPFPGGTFTAATLPQQYSVILVIASVTVAAVYALARSRLGLAFTAVRDDPVLAASRGLWPTGYRLLAFSLSAAFSAGAGVFTAHFQTVVCPDSADFSVMPALLVMVFLGGRGSLRGVVTAAVAFTVLPEVLRLTTQWRLTIYGAILLAVIILRPDGIEGFYVRAERLARRLACSTTHGFNRNRAAVSSMNGADR